MTRQLINTGILPNDGQGDSLRNAGQKINSNFSELYTALGNGTALTVINNNIITATGANKITFNYNTLASLPSATTYDGMFAHVHDTGSAYFAHNSSWIKLADESGSIDVFADVDVSSAQPTNGQALIYDAGAQKWKPGDVAGGGGGGGDGVTTFVALTDTPGSYSGYGNGFVTINSTADGIEFINSFNIDKLSDVDTTSTPPTAGQVLKWNGTKWVPAADATSGGGGLDADTLDGLDSTYYLNYNNLNNKPSIPSAFLGLTDTPANYTGAASRFVKVNSAGTGLEFVLTGASGATELNELSDVTITSPGTGDVLYYDGSGWVVKNGPTIRWTLGANGSSDYTFTGPGFPTPATTDPVLYLTRGHRYVFVNNSGGSHPFAIRVSNGGSAYASGVTNNGAATGNIIFEVPMDAPNTLYYQCTSHSTMGNTINIVS